MPQYFQAVMGTSPEGSGLRLLPVMGGMLVGLAPGGAPVQGHRGQARRGSRASSCSAPASASRPPSTLSSGEGFIGACTAIVGAGAGLTMATVASAALAELSEERAGVGSGVMQALKNTGAPLGSAILGSVLISAYVSRLHLAGLPPAAAHTVRQSIFGGIAVAHALRSPALLASVRAAFVHGTDVAFVVSVGFALAGLVLTLVFLPARARPAGRCGRGTSPEVSGLPPDNEAAGSLRERKKAKTRAAIQHAGPPTVPGAGLRGHHRRTDRGGRRDLALDVFPLLPGQRGPCPHGRLRPAHYRGPRRPAGRAEPGPGGPRCLRAVFGGLGEDELADIRSRAELALAVPELRAGHVRPGPPRPSARSSTWPRPEPACRPTAGLHDGGRHPRRDGAAEMYWVEHPESNLATLLDEALGRLSPGSLLNGSRFDHEAARTRRRAQRTLSVNSGT